MSQSKKIGEANQFLPTTSLGQLNKLGTFFTVQIDTAHRHEVQEDNHDIQWIDLETFFSSSASDYQKWAVRESLVIPSVRVIWQYHQLRQPLEKADVMLVLGSHDLRVAEYAATLFQNGCAPLVTISGGVAHQHDMLKTPWSGTEAEKFAEVMMANGVPTEKILLENAARNTGENYSLAKAVLNTNNITFSSVLVVTKPYMERRAFATGAKQWPDKHIIVTSPPLSFDEYTAGEFTKDDVINIMMGDLQRIDRYGKNGFQIPQEISDEVWQAFEELKKMGYTKHLLPEA